MGASAAERGMEGERRGTWGCDSIKQLGFGVGFSSPVMARSFPLALCFPFSTWRFLKISKLYPLLLPLKEAKMFPLREKSTGEAEQHRMAGEQD